MTRPARPHGAASLPWLAAALAAIPAAAAGQESAESEESDWPTITVTAPATETRALPPQVRIPVDLIVDRQPRSAADVLRGIAGVTVRTNSRGETIARIRGAQDRQTQVFLDGAPLAVPWDGRIDLGLLPAGLLGGVRVVKGAAPIEYGANAVAGVVDFQTRGVSQGDFAHLETGSLGSGSASLVLTERIGAAEAVFAAGGITRDAEPLAGPLPFGQAPGEEGRTNTDLDAGSLFAALGTTTGDLTLRASLLHIAAERGIAPESDRPPEEGPRYWRYPDIALTQATVNAALGLGPDSEIRLVGWRQWFGQRIEQYRSIAYDALRGSQEDEDDTLGGRLTLTHPAGPLALRWAASAQSSTHEQVDTDFPPGVPGERLRFRQNLYSIGVEADATLAPGARLTLGTAYDRAETPLTGNKPPQEAFSDWAGSAALALDIGEDAALTVSGGRRTRFPTARELFGAALGRFALNPDLAPERAWFADAELRWERPGLTVMVNPFLIRFEDTLAQRVLADGRRQRFNLAGATNGGVDALLSYDLAGTLRFELSATALRARADAGTDGGSAPFRRLPQRPSFETLAAIDWNVRHRFDLRAELRAVGSAIDLDAEGEVVDLPAAAELALRATVPLARVGGNRLFLTMAVDNLSDAQIVPQAGLPLPGRLWRVGLRFD
ncbi:TonB-dependent siderophore receptor [Erythrobacter sp. HL-111]|uniref:TonB-dependent receptor plug domain-containing protein n=1 Tax=Erythrobacter sp. HL-111 TaxID=1798193 RepID=UPI0006DA6F2C|nr:TonB-dependent receptor [Erythrobacter sp. HL-111]KPP84453.1 MAG: TonB-dependent receptor [Erythrobacteraceae bacterium HL-111]SDS29004.1 iron complex outermembrane recepter protein [Erythrobacter sp. HL-111]